MASHTGPVNQSSVSDKTFTLGAENNSVTGASEMPILQPVRSTSQSTVSQSVTGTSDNTMLQLKLTLDIQDDLTSRLSTGKI